MRSASIHKQNCSSKFTAPESSVVFFNYSDPQTATYFYTEESDDQYSTDGFDLE